MITVVFYSCFTKRPDFLGIGVVAAVTLFDLT